MIVFVACVVVQVQALLLSPRAAKLSVMGLEMSALELNSRSTSSSSFPSMPTVGAAQKAPMKPSCCPCPPAWAHDKEAEKTMAKENSRVNFLELKAPLATANPFFPDIDLVGAPSDFYSKMRYTGKDCCPCPQPLHYPFHKPPKLATPDSPVDPYSTVGARGQKDPASQVEFGVGSGIVAPVQNDGKHADFHLHVNEHNFDGSLKIPVATKAPS